MTLAAAAALPAFGRTLGAIGVQLYTVRTVLPQDPLKTLKAIEQIGYKEVELSSDHVDEVCAALKQTSLKPIGLHLDANLFARQTAQIPAALDNAKSRGVAYVVCPYVNPADRGGEDVVKKLGDTLNQAGEGARKLGMSLCYHNHAFDFGPAASGGTLLDVLLKATDPKLVSLELDIMWAKVAGVEPVSVLKKYGERIALMHLKNVAPGTAQRFNESLPKEAFREVGNGMIDVPPVLAAAAQAKVKHYFVEQDQTPGDPLDSLRQSYQYLAKVNY